MGLSPLLCHTAAIRSCCAGEDGWHRVYHSACLCSPSFIWLSNKQFYYSKVVVFLLAQSKPPQIKPTVCGFFEFSVKSNEINSSVIFMVVFKWESGVNNSRMSAVIFWWIIFLCNIQKPASASISPLSVRWSVVHRDEQIRERIKHWVKWSGFKICIS